MVQPKKSSMDSTAVPKAIIEESPSSSPSHCPDPDSVTCPTRKHSELGSRSKVTRIRGRPAAANAARERSRVQTLRLAFLELQKTLPSVPPDTKLSKLDVLILATTYIAHLTRTLEESLEEGESRKSSELMHSLKVDGYLHPVKDVFVNTYHRIKKDKEKYGSKTQNDLALICKTRLPKRLNLVISFDNESALHHTNNYLQLQYIESKWPMRSRLYVGATGQFLNSGQSEVQTQAKTTNPDPV